MESKGRDPAIAKQPITTAHMHVTGHRVLIQAGTQPDQLPVSCQKKEKKTPQ